jgi:small nuclear ribonucleoprotein (snRNP)-like protein
MSDVEEVFDLILQTQEESGKIVSFKKQKTRFVKKLFIKGDNVVIIYLDGRREKT